MLKDCDSGGQRALFRTFEFDSLGGKAVWPTLDGIRLVLFDESYLGNIIADEVKREWVKKSGRQNTQAPEGMP